MCGLQVRENPNSTDANSKDISCHWYQVVQHPRWATGTIGLGSGSISLALFFISPSPCVSAPVSNWLWNGWCFPGITSVHNSISGRRGTSLVLMILFRAEWVLGVLPVSLFGVKGLIFPAAEHVSSREPAAVSLFWKCSLLTITIFPSSCSLPGSSPYPMTVCHKCIKARPPQPNSEQLYKTIFKVLCGVDWGRHWEYITANLSLCPILLPSLSSHGCWSQLHSFMNLLYVHGIWEPASEGIWSATRSE